MIADTTNAMLQTVRRTLQNYLLIWLDANLNESTKAFKESLQQLQHIVTSITTFTNVEKCVDFLSEIQEEKVFMIVSDSLELQLIFDIEINTWPQLDSIYILCDNPSIYEKWAKHVPKVKGIFTKIELIYQELQNNRKNCDRTMIPMSFNRIDSLFMYTQFLKEAFLEIDDDDEKCITEFVEYCRSQNDISSKSIEKFQYEYRDHTPIWWYTGPFFMYSMLNRCLRLMDVEIIIKTGFFIRHLHKHIQHLYDEQQSINNIKFIAPFELYRGQGLSVENFDKMKKSTGNLMSFNNFLSTSRDRQISLDYARIAAFDTDSIGILFVMTIDPKVCCDSSIPFADVKDVGYYKGQEEEIVLTTHTIFRVNSIQTIADNDTACLWEVKLILIGNEDHDLKSLVSDLRDDFNTMTGWSRLAYILVKLGESTKAEHLYKVLLESTMFLNYDRAIYYHQLGWVYDSIGEYSKALSSYERSLEIQKVILPPNHYSLAISYGNIGTVYHNMGEYSKALELYEKSLEIRRISLPSNHPELVACYNNIGALYRNIGEYSKALVFHEKCLANQKMILPPNHPALATSYNNIGMIYYHLGEYSKALSIYQQSLQIREIALPPNHPELANSYNNIGLVYDQMGEYSKALSSYKRSLEIRQLILPTNHPDLAASYNNIGLAYDHIGEYCKALASYERSLEIRKIILPPNHPELAVTYNNIGLVYCKMGNYPKGLTYYEKAYAIVKKSLALNHPYITKFKRNIEVIKRIIYDYAFTP